MTDFPAAMPHGAFSEVFPQTYIVTGGFKFAPGLSITRNMTVIRQGDELTLVNSVRLTPEGETALEKLGKVAHLIRLGDFHGADDPYYMDRYHPVLWAPKGMQHANGISAQEELRPGHTPIQGSNVFLFEQTPIHEAILVLEHDGGVLVTCDAYQHWTTFEGCSLLGKLMMKVMGFGPTLIGGPWARRAGTSVRQDFERLLEVPFQHLIPGHGTVLRGQAKDGLRRAITHRFGQKS